MKKKITDYDPETLLRIIEDTFHDYPIGTKVKVLISDLFSYHVVNVTDNVYEKRFWWVKENQVELWVKN